MMLPSRQQARTWSQGLGWFSIGLGVIELFAGRALSRGVGLGGSGALVRACGLREIGTGVGLLKGGNPTPWVWARVAGDALDLATLAPGLQTRHRGAAATAVATVAGVTLLDLACARSLSAAPREPEVDSSRRSGWPLPADEMRGAALLDFKAPRDLRAPDALRPLRERIDVDQPSVLRAWARRFDASPEQVRDAVQAVGDHPDKVEMHLKGSRSSSNASLEAAAGSIGKSR